MTPAASARSVRLASSAASASVDMSCRSAMIRFFEHFGYPYCGDAVFNGRERRFFAAQCVDEGINNLFVHMLRVGSKDVAQNEFSFRAVDLDTIVGIRDLFAGSDDCRNISGERADRDSRAVDAGLCRVTPALN